ncbi:MAG: GNAT family N-acetyltransferase [Bacteroidetes bacterium]|nr:GNAT family N-acetyltransferase [Bacteroidota bacterium]
MENAITIAELTGKEQMLSQLHLVQQLTAGITRSKYSEMLDTMLVNGYRQVGAFENGQCIGISGFWISVKIYSDKYVEMDNVIIDEKHRSKKVGKLLCDWIINEAKQKGCKTAMLDAYVENKDAHRFYFREGYVIRGFHFLKSI